MFWVVNQLHRAVFGPFRTREGAERVQELSPLSLVVESNIPPIYDSSMSAWVVCRRKKEGVYENVV
jgi:hypothetical protein